MWPVERITPYANNSRTHTGADITLLAGSMKQWGVTNPALVDEQGILIVGHARVQAALRLGFKTFPVMVARGWSEAEPCWYAVRDGARSLWAGDRKLTWGHGTQKPVECMRRPIVNSSRAGDLVYEPRRMTDLGVQAFRSTGGTDASAGVSPKTPAAPSSNCAARQRDLVRVRIELLSQLCQRRVTLDGGQHHFGLEGR